jgi:hypothetical protein
LNVQAPYNGSCRPLSPALCDLPCSSPDAVFLECSPGPPRLSASPRSGSAT